MNVLARFQSSLERLSGCPRYAAAFGLGAILSPALAPIGFFPVLFLSLPGIVWLCFAAPTKTKAFLLGWGFGAGYFIFGLYWISFALFVDIKTWGWALPFSAIVGPGLLGLYYAFVPLLAAPFKKSILAYALAFVTFFSAMEWLRGHAFTGFPWNLPGYAWHHVLPMLQPAATVGIYGLTFLTLLFAILPVIRHERNAFRVVAGLLAICFLSGAGRLLLHPQEEYPRHTVRIVQPNIPQSQKWDADMEWRHFEHHVTLMKSPSAFKEPFNFIVWPETAIASDIRQYPEIADYLRLAMKKGSVLVTGALRFEKEAGDVRYYNSITLLEKDTGRIAHYDKHHLVPFGEYMPLQSALKLMPIAASLANFGSFTGGGGPATLKPAFLPSFSPLVCYEAIFPAKAADPQNRPDFLVNVTNDAWYGKTAGPHQHFAIARLRAIEEGLPLVRAANNGISGTVDPLGRIIASLGLDETGVVDSGLPAPLSPTVYARFGDMLFFLMLGLTLIAAFNARRQP